MTNTQYGTRVEELVGELKEVTNRMDATKTKLIAISSESKVAGKLLAEAITNLKVAQAEAFMQIQGEGKTSYATIGDREFSCSNEQLRTAFVGFYTESFMRALSKAESTKQALDTEIFALKDLLNADIAMTRGLSAAIEAFSKNADLEVATRKIDEVKSRVAAETSIQQANGQLELEKQKTAKMQMELAAIQLSYTENMILAAKLSSDLNESSNIIDKKLEVSRNELKTSTNNIEMAEAKADLDSTVEDSIKGKE